MRIVKLAVLLSVLALAVTACGNGDDVDGAPEGRSADGETASPADDRGADLDDGVAAVVDGEEISTDFVDEQVTSFTTNPDVATALDEDDGDQVLAVLRAQVLTNAIVNLVALRSAEELDVPVTDEDIADARSQIETELGGAEALDQALEQEGMSESQLGDQLQAFAALRNVEAALAEQDNGEETAADPEATSPEQARAEEYIRERLGEADVVVNTTYGTWDPVAREVVPDVELTLPSPDDAPGS